MSNLNQHGRLQPRCNDNEGSAHLVFQAPDTPPSQLDGGEEAVAYPTRGSSGHPEHESAFLDPADAWKEFQVHRSSAEYHLDNYLYHLARSCEELDDMPNASQGIAFISPLATCPFLTRWTTDLSTETQPTRNRVEIQMKISRDTAIRDLLAMETVLAYAKNLRKKPRKLTYSPMVATWTAACSVSAFTFSAKIAASISAAGAVLGAVALASPPAWHLYQDYRLDSIRTTVQELRNTFQNDIGTVSDASRDILKGSQYKFLQRMFADL
ncbi:hypothetical protein VE03_01810 [Pseudogymnoascus sp. 23342-1-I1]|nr:hypothetical protein VE03_01810 [Pseudogymnoascus sp. 23342-1-I1]